MREAAEALGREFAAGVRASRSATTSALRATCRSRSRPGPRSTCSSRRRRGRWTSWSRRGSSSPTRDGLSPATSSSSSSRRTRVSTSQGRRPAGGRRHPDRDREPPDRTGGPVRAGEPAEPRALGAARPPAHLGRERPPGAGVRGAGRGRRGLRVRHRRAGGRGPRVRLAFRPGEDTYPAGRLSGRGGRGDASAGAGAGLRGAPRHAAPRATLARLGFLAPLPAMR